LYMCDEDLYYWTFHYWHLIDLGSFICSAE
jgi:hypothetical protein